MLAGYPTDGLAVGEYVILKGPVEALGSAEHKNAAGQQIKVHGLKFVGGANPKPVDGSQADRQLRTWTDDTGRYRFEAEFVEFKSGVVKLRAKDKSTKDVKLDRLSKDDQEWVQNQMKSRREEHSKSKPKR